MGNEKINLNWAQKGVYGLEQQKSKTNGNVRYAGTSNDIKLFQFLDNDGKNVSNGAVALYNTKTGGIEYVYWAKDKNGETVRVRAYDYDGDGNIDAYKQRCGCDSPSDGTWATYVNPKDDGTDNFKKQEAFNWFDPSTWFK